MIRPVADNDVATITRIYNHYIENTFITFEIDSVTEAEIQTRINLIRSLNYPWVVEEEDGRVTGYAYASRWRERKAYKHTVEVTVYLDPDSQGKGIGSRLYASLFDALKNSGVHVAIGGIALPNPESVALHEKLGMKKMAHFEQVGRKFDNWIDVGYWQIIF